MRGWMPAARAAVAKVWRRSWNRILGSPDLLRIRSNRWAKMSGWYGRRSSRQKTRSWSGYG